MIRLVLVGMMAILMISGCTAKEFNSGVNDATDGVTRVIRGTNN
ncbi:MAG: hypothetical protein AB7U44_08865 [Sulfuricurvum sp.]|jgi:hypothetical protein|nr:hypothetical protein [Sulfuricurvum sp.]MDD2839080.1 hypothetical protein [Sulfuricurvum sp.]MDD3596619.1 hypothetical protein [Sulfuricurvum sp.]MDD4884785.1 hypothetical protein [Sulfuricurvum sp.]